MTPDALFSDPRLAAVYDAIEGPRNDLDAYERLIVGTGARSVVDVGCGTGELACRLARRGLTVTGVEPAAASVDIAHSKPDAERVNWIVGVADDLPRLHADVAVMTANVAQVFLDDAAWSATLAGVRRALNTDGRLIFETRDPGAAAWEAWATLDPFTVDSPSGPVGCALDIVAVDLPLVTFRWTYTFADTGESISSESTLRFRSEADLRSSLGAADFTVDEVRDAPDRPGKELVVVARPI